MCYNLSYQYPQSIPHLLRPGITGRAGEFFVFASVINPWFLYRDRAEARLDRPLGLMAVSNHQAMARLRIAQILVAFNVVGHLCFHSQLEHLLGTLSQNQIERIARFLFHSLFQINYLIIT
ncbi:MAG: hypothetical protein ACLFWL_16205 [Candidatus Brocadiia bacterium]